MKEEFYESSCAPQNSKTQKVFYIIYNIFFIIACVAFVISLYLFLLFPKDFGFLVIAVFSVICGSTFFLVKRRLLCCYDYTFVSGEVRIVKVISGKRRKRFLIFDCKDVYRLGKVGSDTFEQLIKTPDIKKKMATPNGYSAVNQLYYIAVRQGAENNIVILECDEKFLAFVAEKAGRSVIEKDYK